MLDRIIIPKGIFIDIFQVLNGHGIPEENIVVMMRDDIAENRENPYKGKIFNNQKGIDVRYTKIYFIQS